MRMSLSSTLHISPCNLRHHLSSRVYQHSRFYSTVLLSNRSQVYKVQVPVGGNGTVQLDILNPTEIDPSLPKQILAFLPPGPFFPFSPSTSAPIPPIPKHASNVPLLLSSLLPTAMIVTLNYRLSPIPSPFTFPNPIHDIYKAYDYIISPSSPHNNGQTPQVGLYGSHIGGALAIALGLTQPMSIHALAVSEPLVDWVSLDGDEEESINKRASSSSKRKPKLLPSASPDPTRLLSIRSKLFRDPQSYFDAFASPTLFLRAPGHDCPDTNPDPFLTRSRSSSRPAQAFGPYDDDIDTHLDSRSRPKEDYTYVPKKRRKVLRRWPPNTTDPLLPPHTRIYVRDTPSGEAGILYAQGAEFADLMRKACFYGREKGLAESRVNLRKMEDRSENEVEGTIGLKEAAEWLARKFAEH